MNFVLHIVVLPIDEKKRGIESTLISLQEVKPITSDLLGIYGGGGVKLSLYFSVK